MLEGAGRHTKSENFESGTFDAEPWLCTDNLAWREL